ncbi:MAG: ComEA family DNA-binding protein [Burkholderiaceae bacterium]
MFKKLLLSLAAFIATMGIAFAAVDVNKATQAELDAVKGIGPAISKAIVDERAKGGAFKDWADFEARVKGVGEKSGAKMSEAGLTVGGKSYAGAPAKADAGKKEEKKPVADAGKKEEKTATAKKDEAKPVAAAAPAAAAGAAAAPKAAEAKKEEPKKEEKKMTAKEEKAKADKEAKHKAKAEKEAKAKTDKEAKAKAASDKDAKAKDAKKEEKKS